MLLTLPTQIDNGGGSFIKFIKAVFLYTYWEGWSERDKYLLADAVNNTESLRGFVVINRFWMHPKEEVSCSKMRDT